MTAHADKRAFATEIVRRLVAAGHTALWAGGCVRDLLMGREPEDYDVATTATPEQVRELIGPWRTLAVGESFGVILVLGPKGSGLQVEVATFRTEGPYADGRRPSHVCFATPREDARRRDFTINGMFYDPLTEQVLDYVGGEHDLRRGILRAIGDPHARMTEDKLRMLRAVRFAATLDFELEADTAAAIQEMAPQILVVSWERIAQELRRMLRHPHRRRAVRLAQQLGLLEPIIPELAPVLADREHPEWTHTLETLEALRTDRFETAAAVLLHPLPAGPAGTASKTVRGGTVRGVCRRLRLSNDETENIAWLVAHRTALEGAEQFSPARLKRLLAQPLAVELLAITEAEARARNRESTSAQFVREYLQQIPPEELHPPPLITGDDLIALGLAPGPKFKELLETLRDAQLNGEVRTPAEALELARRLAGDDRGNQQ
jgi:poly(A) polymerase